MFSLPQLININSKIFLRRVRSSSKRVHTSLSLSLSHTHTQSLSISAMVSDHRLQASTTCFYLLNSYYNFFSVSDLIWPSDLRKNSNLMEMGELRLLSGKECVTREEISICKSLSFIRI
jgi:hypothetical protein